MIYLFLADGFEEVEAITTVDYLRRAGLSVVTVGIGGREVRGTHDIRVTADKTEDEIRLNDEVMGVILPGRYAGHNQS